MSKWTTRNRASVMTSDIEVSMFMKEQFHEAIEWLIEKELDFEFNIEKGDSIKLDVFKLCVYNLPWANLLEEFAQVLKQSDFDSDEVKDGKE